MSGGQFQFVVDALQAMRYLKIMSNIQAIILAAGKSTRMKSATPKVLHPVCGRPLVCFPVEAAKKAGARHIITVISPDCKDRFQQLFEKSVSLAVQLQQLGTGDAVMAAEKSADKNCEYTLIIPGDVPLIKAETLKKLIEGTSTAGAHCGILTMVLKDPSHYGRIVRNNNGNVNAIVESRDANTEQAKICEVNSSIYCVKTEWLFEALKKISPTNAQKEYYLTDIIKVASEEGLKVTAISTKDSHEPMGVNTRKELALANRLARYEMLDELMANGVGIQDELHTYIDYGVKIGADTVIEPHCFIKGTSQIGKNCKIENGVVIINSEIGDNVHIKPYSVIEESKIMDSAVVGPFARFRPGTVIESEARVGNFVEIKNAILKKGSKANHLSYIGDAVIGERTNVGCGTITCNYDGKDKHKTIIGEDVFIGSDVQFVAPVEIGNGATIGAGSTITEDVPKNSLAIARSRQVVKKNWKKSA